MKCWDQMKLRDLFSGDAVIGAQHADVAVAGLAVDSRAVKAGDVFFALAGAKTDGARFIDQAIASGAVAVVSDRTPENDNRVPFIAVSNPRRALALAAARFYPRQPDTIAAVTGTSGKTSVAVFLRQIWAQLGHSAASMGTIGIVTPSGEIGLRHTTPDPIEIHALLAQLQSEGVNSWDTPAGGSLSGDGW